MALAVDATTATGTSVNNVATMTVSNMTVGTGSNRALCVQLWFSNSTLPTGLTVTWDSGGTNQAMTAISGTTAANSGITGTSVLYGLVAPTSGNKSLVISWTGNTEAHATAVSFTGVNQTNVATAFPNGTNVVDTTPVTSPITITITSQTGDITVAAFAQNVSVYGAVSGTTIAEDDTGPNLAVVSSYASGASTVTMTAAFTGTSGLIASACDVTGPTVTSMFVPLDATGQSNIFRIKSRAAYAPY